MNVNRANLLWCKMLIRAVCPIGVTTSAHHGTEHSRTEYCKCVCLSVFLIILILKCNFSFTKRKIFWDERDPLTQTPMIKFKRVPISKIQIDIGATNPAGAHVTNR